MGKVKTPLAERRVARLASEQANKRSMVAVGGIPGLYLSRGEGASARSWLLRYMFDGKRRDLGLGSVADVTLAQARERAREQRKLIVEGIDPIDAKREQRAERIAARAARVTFQQCTDQYLDAHGDAWRNARHRLQWHATLEKYAHPVIGAMDVAAVNTALVLRILEPVWKVKTETASRVRGRIEKVIDWATVRNYRSGENPARWKGHLDKLLARRSKIAPVKHFAALDYHQVGEFMQDLRKQEGVGARAVEFAILTAARSGEARGARRDEFDLAARTWVVPASRMKGGKEHAVPLSDAAVAVIEKMNAMPRLGDFVFPGLKEGTMLSDMSLGAVLKRMGRSGITVHGFRSTFRDWAAECTSTPAEVAELALAHTISNKTEAAYRRGNLFAKRVRLMSDWSRYCNTVQKAAEVVPMNRASAPR